MPPVRRLITAETIDAEFAAGRRELHAPRGVAIVTPAAWSRAQQLGVTIELNGSASSPSPSPGPPPQTRTPAPPEAERGRTVDPSGAVLVRGDAVRLARFPGAGPDKAVLLKDVVTGKDLSPMTAGFMAWSAADSFPWELTYDEIDYVLEGVLQITIGGRVLEGRPGDVLYIPKGSKIVFGTPSRVRIFYVTYPADWAAPALAPH